MVYSPIILSIWINAYSPLRSGSSSTRMSILYVSVSGRSRPRSHVMFPNMPPIGKNWNGIYENIIERRSIGSRSEFGISCHFSDRLRGWALARGITLHNVDMDEVLENEPCAHSSWGVAYFAFFLQSHIMSTLVFYFAWADKISYRPIFLLMWKWSTYSIILHGGRFARR